jgi:hypothetical protein
MVSKPKCAIDSQQARRAVLRIGAGGLLAVGLVACGGGGGDSNDSSSFRAVFEALSEGLTAADVVRMVGRSPNEISSDSTYIWINDSEDLWVDFTSEGVIYWATYHQVSPSLRLRKDFF